MRSHLDDTLRALRPAAKQSLENSMEAVSALQQRLEPIAGGAEGGKLWSSEFTSSYKGGIVAYFTATLDQLSVPAVNLLDSLSKELEKASGWLPSPCVPRSTIWVSLLSS